MIEAQVKKDARWSIITACAGREFIKGEYRIVPAGMEAEAKANPFLETRAVKPPAKATKAPAKAAKTPAKEEPEKDEPKAEESPDEGE